MNYLNKESIFHLNQVLYVHNAISKQEMLSIACFSLCSHEKIPELPIP